MELHKLSLDNDTKNILQTLLNDEVILRYLLIVPTSASDNVQTITTIRPSIIENKTLSQRFSEYYLGDDPVFMNWAKQPDENSKVQGRIFFYPAPDLRGSIDKCDYIFDMLLPFEWHQKTNVTFKVLRRVLELFKDTRLFGDIGKANSRRASPIFSVSGYCGYQIIFNNYNFVK